MLSLYTVLLALAAAAAAVAAARRRLRYWARRGVPQLPGAHWLCGHYRDAVLLRSAPSWHLCELYRQAAPDEAFCGFYIFHTPCLLLRDPTLIKQMFAKDTDYFTDRYFGGWRQKDSLGAKNLFSLRNPAWRYARKRINPTFSAEKIKNMVPLMMENGKSVMEYIDELKAESNVKLIEVQALNSNFITDVIANIGFGMFTNSFRDPEAEFTKCSNAVFFSVKRFIPLLILFFLQWLADILGPIIYFDMSFIKKPFWEAVRLREETGTKRGDYIDSILTLKNGKQDPIHKFEGKNLQDLSSQFFSGFEASITAATATFIELAKNMDIQDRAREDVKTAVAAHGWTYEAFNEMRYLEKCIREALRMYPTTPHIDRRVSSDYKIPGSDAVLPRGTGVYVSVGALHRDPKYFPNPDVFDPDRFENGNATLDAYMPFGVGVRTCIAPKLGILQVKIVLALVLEQYVVRPPYTTSLGDQFVKPADRATPPFKRAMTLDQRSTFTVFEQGAYLEFIKI